MAASAGQRRRNKVLSEISVDAHQNSANIESLFITLKSIIRWYGCHQPNCRRVARVGQVQCQSGHLLCTYHSILEDCSILNCSAPYATLPPGETYHRLPELQDKWADYEDLYRCKLCSFKADKMGMFSLIGYAELHLKFGHEIDIHQTKETLNKYYTIWDPLEF